jgi:hypothetical protein
MMPLVTGKLEDFLWTTKTCSNLNSSYNYIKKFCFELSFLTFIPCSPEHENAYNNNNNNILLIQWNISISTVPWWPLQISNVSS